MKKSKRVFKVVYVEVSEKTYKTLERLTEKLELPKTKVVTQALNLLAERTDAENSRAS